MYSMYCRLRGDQSFYLSAVRTICMYCIQLHNTGGNFYILYLVYLHINNSYFTREILKYMYTVKIYHLKLLACKKTQ